MRGDITPQQKADAVSAQVRARAAYREEMRARLEIDPRAGNQRVIIGTDAMRAMYVVGMGNTVNRIVDLKAMIRKILPEKRVCQYRFMHGENVEFLVHREEYADIAKILVEYLLKIKGDYTPDGMMTKKSPTEKEEQRGARNARYAYRAMDRFAREVRAPASVREYYVRILRKLEKKYPKECNVISLGEDGDWDLSRRVRNKRVGVSTGGQSVLVGKEKDSFKDVEEGEGYESDYMSDGSRNFASCESLSESEDLNNAEQADRERKARQDALCEMTGESEDEAEARETIPDDQ